MTLDHKAMKFRFAENAQRNDESIDDINVEIVDDINLSDGTSIHRMTSPNFLNSSSKKSMMQSLKLDLEQINPSPKKQSIPSLKLDLEKVD